MNIIQISFIAYFIIPIVTLFGYEGVSFIEFESAIRHDQIGWNFIVPSPRPVIETRLSIQDIHIFQIGLTAGTIVECCHYPLLVRAKADYGFILAGNQKETLETINYDSQPDGMTTQSLTGRHIADDQFVADLSICIGYPCYFYDCSVTFTPLVGYAYDIQSLRAKSTRRDFFIRNIDHPAPTSSDQCVCNKYVMAWYGPWIGVDLEYNTCGCFDLFAQFEYHFARLTAKRNSNIGFNPIDYYHRGTHHAHGSLISLGGNYSFCHCWYAGVKATYQDWSAHKSAYIGHALEDADLVLPDSVPGDHMRVENKWRSFALAITVGTTF